MQLGTYNINEQTLDSLLKSYNSVIGAGDTLGVQAKQDINLRLFNNSTSLQIPYQVNTTNGATDSALSGSGSNLLFEYGNNGVNPLNFTTTAHHSVIVLGADNAVNFNDLGNSQDRGDTIIGGNANQAIATTMGKNLVVAGSGQDTIYGGGTKDTLIGGGNTSIQAGGAGNDKLYGGLAGSAHDTLDAGNSSGNDKLHVWMGNNSLVAGSGHDTLIAGSGDDTLVGGSGTVSMQGGGATSMVAGSGLATMMGGFSATSQDTMVGGSGADFMKAKFGDNLIVGGTSGTDTIVSRDNGTGGGSGGDVISLTGGANAMVNIGAGAATDTVVFGGTQGNDTITTSGNVEIQVQNTEHLTSIDSSGGVTTLSFQDGQTLTYSGSGHVTLTFQ